ncbi:MAG: DUF3644 domain-containing protein [Candidatus Dojkabacteria bacterium]|nr:DUF3644 domain-containing protein [Candidatus Dojkabacteria bacterium]MDD4560997.1 DUF3644 domain-containing protein [Candidatus Dojkabacteria bacterium]
MISKSKALIKKSKDAMLAGIEIYNNPNITFKTEIFIVLSIISWTYLIHAYLKEKKVDYRYFHHNGKRKVFDKTSAGNYKYWSLFDCISGEFYDLNLDKGTKANLEFLLGIRHEIEHQMTSRIDSAISARIQANCLDYNEYLKKWFGEKEDISSSISYSLQLSEISAEQMNLRTDSKVIAKNVLKYIEDFDNTLDEETYKSSHFAYRVILTPKIVNHLGQADQVIEFIPANTELSKELNKRYVIIKEKEKPKFMAKQIIEMMHKEGYHKFNQHQHTRLWQERDAKNPSKGYGTKVVNYWYWYENWIEVVRKHCKEIYFN